MKLYFSPGTCSLAPHIVLHEANRSAELVKVTLSRHLTADGTDFYSVNPKGQVPTLLLDDGAVLTEGPVIAQYIAELAGNTSLLPAAGSLARYRVLEWQNYITSELHKSFAPLFNPHFDVKAKALHAELLRKKFVWVDAKLSASTYLTGADFTVADAYLFAVTRWSGHVGLEIADLKHLQRFLAEVAARPAVQAAMTAEG